MKKRLSIVFLVLALLFIFYSCRKMDIQKARQSNDVADLETVNSFFQLSANADPLLIRITGELRKKEAGHPFIKKLIATAGIPKWEYSELKLSIVSNISTVKVNAIGQDGRILSTQNTNDTTVLVPFVFAGVKRVNSFLAIHLSDSLPIKLFRGKDFATFGYNETGNKPTAKSIAMRCMSFDQAIFKHDTFRVSDKTLALFFSGNRDTSGLIVLKHSNTQNTSIKPNLVISFESCVGGSWVPDPNAQWNTYTQDHPPLINVGGDCSTVWFVVDNSDGYIPDFYSNPLSNASSGGVAANPSLFAEADRIPESWEACDENGYYYSRIESIDNLLIDDAFNISPCDKLNIMPLDDNGNNTYGLRFKRVAQTDVSTAIRTRLDSIANVAPTSIFTSFHVQNIVDAYGPVVNCDYFPVFITALPPNMTGESLVEFFRKYTNNFVKPPQTASFSAYSDGLFSDATKYYSAFEQSLGTLVHLNLINDGTVVESEYYRSSSPFTCRFTYSTISSPLDGNHPVSGNREFGIYANPGGNGYTFYTMGVDRTSDWFFGVGNSAGWGFDSADALWKGMQDKMTDFINNNGGQAYRQEPVIARPKWSQVQKYLRGEISFSLLKARLGC